MPQPFACTAVTSSFKTMLTAHQAAQQAMRILCGCILLWDVTMSLPGSQPMLLASELMMGHTQYKYSSPGTGSRTVSQGEESKLGQVKIREASTGDFDGPVPVLNVFAGQNGAQQGRQVSHVHLPTQQDDSFAA